MFGWILFADMYIALGALSILFSHELATAVNKLSVKLYEMLPAIKERIPLPRFAGTQKDCRSTRIYFQLLGALMLLGGAVLLGRFIMHGH